jgi:hypothetical protein
MTKRMDMESMSIQMGLNMKGTGKMTNNMDSVQNIGLMEVSIKETILTLRRRVMADTFGLMETNILENGMIMLSMVKEFMFGQMAEFIAGNGRKI